MTSELPPWSDDPYWASALTALAASRDSGVKEITVNLDAVESDAFLEDGPAFRLMKAIVSVWEREGFDGFRGAPPVMLALLVRLAELSHTGHSRPAS